MVAGFQPPSAGRVLIGGKDVTHVPASQRDIGLVFQSYALFPHLNVSENVAYGLRVRGLPAARRGAEVAEALRLVGLSGLQDRQIGELSGGQQQRVALARAIAIRPRVLLFDEPLSNLDAKLRVQVRDEIAELQRRLGITTIYVTHDQEEAMAISSRIAVMQAGRIAQLGTAEDLYRRPASAFVAGFLGRANLLAGSVRERDGSKVTVELETGQFSASVPDAPPVGARVLAVVRPEAILLEPRSIPGGLPAVVVGRAYLGEKAEYKVRLGGQLVQVTRPDPPEPDPFQAGQDVSIRLPETGIHFLLGDGPDSGTEERPRPPA